MSISLASLINKLKTGSRCSFSFPTKYDNQFFNFTKWLGAQLAQDFFKEFIWNVHYPYKSQMACLEV